MSEDSLAQQPIPQHRKLSGEVAYQHAIDEVVARACVTLHVFDPDLASGGYGSVQRHALLRDFLMRSRNNRLEIALHETDYVTGRCPRLMNLLQLHSHQMTIYKTEEHARIASDPFVIADEIHYVHRFHAEGARFLVAMDDISGAAQLEERFRQIREASHPAVFATTLGL